MDKIFKLYEDCVDWLNGDNTYTAKELVEQAVIVLEEVKELNSVWSDCVFHVNNWNENNIEEQSEQAEVLVEEICGYLGEYFYE